jgi:hypothetical protein
MSASPGATSRQTWAIFCATGYDVRAASLSLDEASRLIDLSKADKVKAVAEVADLPGAVQKKKAGGSSDEWAALYDKAHAAGMEAGEGHNPAPMVVTQRADVLDDTSAVKNAWFVPEGVCGFAWVTVTPGTCSFAKWLAKNHDARKGYYGGMELWVGYFNQSYERKMAYAEAFASVVSEAGVKCYAGGRLD